MAKKDEDKDKFREPEKAPEPPQAPVDAPAEPSSPASRHQAAEEAVVDQPMNPVGGDAHEDFERRARAERERDSVRDRVVEAEKQSSGNPGGNVPTSAEPAELEDEPEDEAVRDTAPKPQSDKG